MPKNFAKLVLLIKIPSKELVVEAIKDLEDEITYMEYSRLIFNPAAEIQESINEAKQLLQKLRDLQKTT